MSKATRARSIAKLNGFKPIYLAARHEAEFRKIVDRDPKILAIKAEINTMFTTRAMARIKQSTIEHHIKLEIKALQEKIVALQKQIKDLRTNGSWNLTKQIEKRSSGIEFRELQLRKIFRDKLVENDWESMIRDSE